MALTMVTDALVKVKAKFAGAVHRLLEDKLNDDVTALDFGADPTGIKDSTDALKAMITAGYFVIPYGKYLVSDTLSFKADDMKKIEIGNNVELFTHDDIDVLIITSPFVNIPLNNMRVIIDLKQGNYTKTAVTIRGGFYFAPPGGMDKLTNKPVIGEVYCYNRGGAININGEAGQLAENGTGLSIDCSGDDQEILVFNQIHASCTGFTKACTIKVGGNKLNFISSLDIYLSAWLCVNHFVDLSQPKSSGNLTGGIGDIFVRLKSQPNKNLNKYVLINDGIGYMNYSRFELTLWDAHLMGYKAGSVDALSGNEYSSTLETYDYPLTKALNVKDASLFPIANYKSRLQRSNIIYSCDTEMAKYMYLSKVQKSMSVLEACKAIAQWCSENNIKSGFSFEVNFVDAAQSIKDIFYPWLAEVGYDEGYLRMDASYYNGAINTIRVSIKADRQRIGKDFEYSIVWSSKAGDVDTKIVKWSSDTQSGIRSLTAKAEIGLKVFDTGSKKAVFYGGDSKWYDATGQVVIQ